MGKKRKNIEDYTKEEIMEILNMEIRPKEKVQKPVPLDELLLKTFDIKPRRTRKKKN